MLVATDMVFNETIAAIASSLPLWRGKNRNNSNENKLDRIFSSKKPCASSQFVKRLKKNPVSPLKQ
ncbi:MAG: hypothetical protein SXA11_03920 [Cyanobacteriota bacterium]|nr:hypothetical protein [Cyanobacteriota bacterium]